MRVGVHGMRSRSWLCVNSAGLLPAIPCSARMRVGTAMAYKVLLLSATAGVRMRRGSRELRWGDGIKCRYRKRLPRLLLRATACPFSMHPSPVPFSLKAYRNAHVCPSSVRGDAEYSSSVRALTTCYGVDWVTCWLRGSVDSLWAAGVLRQRIESIFCGGCTAAAGTGRRRHGARGILGAAGRSRRGPAAHRGRASRAPGAERLLA